MEGRQTAPRVGVTGPNKGGWPAWVFTRLALYRVGAVAVRITTSRIVDCTTLSGLVIGGGADVSEPVVDTPDELTPPASRVRWPRRVIDLLLAPLVLLVRWIAATRRHGVDPARDAMELRLLAYAREHGLPVLGICRGSQLMNLAEGGTLLRDVNTLYDERPQLYTVLPRREVSVLDGSVLQSIVGRRSLLVNSLHFHAVGEPARGMRIVACEPSGVPQAVENSARRFWLGVQWHPEYLPQQESHQKIFAALAEAARQVCTIAPSDDRDAGAADAGEKGAGAARAEQT
jgi:putative glutamine amidotransferase